jgi:hypothetical protein
MNIIQSPKNTNGYEVYSMFLAGGISGCDDWQKYVCNQLVELYKPNDEVYIFNPRRKGDLTKEGAMARKQILWEYKYLQLCDFYAFWFPQETLCPITLFELGKYANCNAVVGIHPDYKRRFDLEIQLPLISKKIKIVYDLDEFVEAIAEKMLLERKDNGECN